MVAHPIAVFFKRRKALDLGSCLSISMERVCSVLNTEDDLIFNVLIDYANIDRVARCDDKDLSESLLYCVRKDERDGIRVSIQDVYYLPNGGK